MIKTLKEYRDVFAWSYKDLKGVDPNICEHTIPLKFDAKPSRQRPYTYNETFAKKIKAEIDKLKEAEFIYEIEHTNWVLPIVVVPKKNGEVASMCESQEGKRGHNKRQLSTAIIIEHVMSLSMRSSIQTGFCQLW